MLKRKRMVRRKLSDLLSKFKELVKGKLYDNANIYFQLTFGRRQSLFQVSLMNQMKYYLKKIYSKTYIFWFGCMQFPNIS